MLLEHVVSIVPDVNSILWEFKFELMYLTWAILFKLFLFVKTIAFLNLAYKAASKHVHFIKSEV